MNAKQSWVNRLMALALLAALTGLFGVGQVVAIHCAPSVLKPLPVQEDSWTRFYQYSLAASGEATGSEITYGKIALASLVCPGEEALPVLGVEQLSHTEGIATPQMDSLERFQMYLLGNGMQ